MNWEELKLFLAKVDKRLHERSDKIPNREYMLWHFIKLSEEVGELAEQILAYNDLQRSDKNLSKDKTALGDEIADVLITAMLVAKDLNIDIAEALKRKMKKISKRLII